MRISALIFTFFFLLIPGVLVSHAHAETASMSQSSAPGGTYTQAIKDLLKKMSGASHTLNYQGSFTYQHKDNPLLQSFRVLHWVENGIEYERLQHLNGLEREITRSGKSLDCGSLGDELLQGKLGYLGADIARLDQLYKFEILGPERVAGRLATKLLAMPLDRFRYSYFLSIDDETGLVLKSWLVDEVARPLERYQFIELQLNPDTSTLQQQPAAKLHRKASPQIGDCNPAIIKQPETWKPGWIPPGFAFVGQRQVKEKIDMLMYTDGLTTFSIFVQEANGAIPQGIAQRGATLAVMDELNYKNKVYRVTVVGEIPAITAQKIAQNMGGI